MPVPALAGNMQNPAEVARLLSCSRDALAGLVELGALEARVTPLGLRISDESIGEFSRQYSSLSSIATVEQNSSKALMDRCQDRGIWMLLVPMPRQGPQPFIYKTDQGKPGTDKVARCRPLMALHIAVWCSRSRAAACGRAAHSTARTQMREIIRSPTPCLL